jgi:two-component system phosphate regulon response regulator OmpR
VQELQRKLPAQSLFTAAAIEAVLRQEVRFVARIAVVDDDRKLLELLTGYLAENGHQPSAFEDPRKFLQQKLDGFDLVILDILMPAMDGFDVLREMRKETSLPVVMLTARGDVYDRIVGLELGADDYLPKPFEPRELLARIEAVLRRTGPKGRRFERLEYETFSLVPESMKLFVHGEEVSLTTAEFTLLHYFCSNPFRVLTRDMIMEHTKDITWESFDRSVDVLVSRIRKKLADDPSSPRIIKTVWGEGYMFIAKREE